MADAKTTITITARDETRAAFDRINQSLSGMVGAVGRLPVLGAGLAAAFSGTAIVAAVKGIVDGADELQKASQKYGIAVEQLSALKYAGALSDASLEAIGNGLKKLSVNMLDTAAGAGDAKDAFKALGISVTEAGGGLKSSEQVLGELADKFSGMEDGAGKTALAVKIFGRAGADLIPLLNQGAKGLADMKEEAEKLGVIVGGDLARKSEEFNDNLTRLGAAADAFKISLAQGALPALVDFTNAMVEGVKIGGGFGEMLRLFVFNLDAMTSEKPAEEIRRLTKALEDYQKAGSAGKFMQSPTGFLFGGREEDLKKQIEFLKYLQRQEALATTAGLSGRLDSKDIGPKALAKAPDLPDSGKKKQTDDELAQMRKLGEEYERMFLAAEKYTAGLDAQIAKGGALTQAEQQLLEVERQMPAEWAASIRPLLERADALEKQKKQMEEGKKLFEETRTDMEKLAATETHLAELLDAGAITWDTYARAVFDAQDKIKEAKQPLDEMTEFVKQAARNMQAAMADGFFNIMQGKFDDLAGNFKQTIDRMVANLLASQLMNWLTGDFGKTGQMGGFLSSIFGNMFGGARADGGPVAAGSAYLVGERGPELFVPRQAGNIVPNGGGMAVYNTFTINGPTDRRSQQQIASEVGAAVDRAMRRNR